MNIAPKSVVALALAGAGLLAAAKLGAVLKDGSSAMLASTVQSLIDVSFLTLLIYGISSSALPSRKAADRGFWTAIVPILLYALGAGVTLYDGIEHIARPRTPAGFSYDEVLLALGIVLSCLTLWLISQASEQAGMLSEERDVSSALTVQAASSAAGHLAAFGGVVAASRWDVAQADGIAATVVGLLLMLVAAVMAVNAGRLLRAAGTMPQEAAASPPIVAELSEWAPEVKSMPAAQPVVPTQPVLPAEPVVSPPQQPIVTPSGKPQVVARHGKKGGGKRRR